MKRLLLLWRSAPAFASLMMVGCAATHAPQHMVSLEVLRVPKSLTAPTNEQLRAAAVEHQTYRMPLDAEGNFRYDKTQPVRYATEYDHKGEKVWPVAYDSRKVGTTISGSTLKDPKGGVNLNVEFSEVKYQGDIPYGPVVKQPVFSSQKITTSCQLRNDEMSPALLVGGPPNDKLATYLIARLE